MKFFTFPALAAALFVSALAALPFLPAAKERQDRFVIETTVRASTVGILQVFYDDGTGPAEERSGHITVRAGSAPYRIPVTAGTIRRIRFDPLDRAGTVTVSALQLRAGATGRLIAELPLDGFKPEQQIASLRRTAEGLEIVTTPDATDPQLVLELPQPVTVAGTWPDVVRGAAPRVLPVFVLLAALLLLLDRVPRFAPALAAAGRALAQRPRRAVALVAAVAVVASAYPVVFLGKSHVSPNLGTILLYDTYPTLPGYTASDVTDVKLSDVGAVMWSHLPLSVIQHRALAQGELPLWNRYNSAGTPLLGQGQSMFGDPLHFLAVAANGAAWAWDLKYLVAKWLFAAGLAFTVFALTRHLPAALIVAGAAPFIGFFLYRLNHPAFFSLCYAPWPLWCLVRAAQATTRRGTALALAGLLVANLALMASGTVKEAYMLLVCMNLAGAAVLAAAAATWRERLGKLAALAWAGAIFALLTAPAWLTFLRTLGNAYTAYNAASAYQIQPTLLLGAFDEIFYRPLMARDQVFSPSLNVLLLLGFLLFLATLRRHFAQPAVVALAASSLVPLALAFGLVPPAWIVALPFLGNIAHIDNTFSCALIVLWSVLAGVGFATVAPRLGTREGRHDLIVAALLLGALVFGWIAFRQAVHRPILGPTFTVNQPGTALAVTPFIWHYLAALLLAIVALGLLAHRAGARRAVGPARGLLLGACTLVLLWRHGLHAESAGFETFTARPTERVDFHARSGAMDFTRAAQRSEPGRGFGFQGNFFPGWTGVYDLETIHGPDALVNPWLRELVGVSGVERLWDWRLYLEPPGLAAAQPFLDALNVRWYFDLLSKHPALVGAPALERVHESDFDVYRSRTAWPRAFFTDRVQRYEKPEEFVAAIKAAAGRPLAAVQTTDPAASAAVAPLSADLATRTAEPARDYTLTANTTAFTVKASGPGVVVLTETWWPGDFRAEIDGKKVPVLRLNHAFKGVKVDAAGDYRVTVRYLPRHFPRYLMLCGVGAALLALSLWFALRPARSA